MVVLSGEVSTEKLGYIGVVVNHQHRHEARRRKCEHELPRAIPSASHVERPTRRLGKTTGRRGKHLDLTRAHTFV